MKYIVPFWEEKLRKNYEKKKRNKTPGSVHINQYTAIDKTAW